MRRSGEAGIAASPATPARHAKPFALVGEVVKAFAAGFVVDYGADRNVDLERMTVSAGAVAAFAVPAAFRLVLGVVAELEQRVLVGGGDELDVAPAAAVATARAAFRHIL